MNKLNLLIFIIVLSQVYTQDFKFSERLSVENVRDPSKNLYQFNVSFEFPIDFEQVDQEVYVFSRSVLENIFVSANSTVSRVETACGSINQLFLEDSHIGEKYFFPDNGMKIMSDSKTNYPVLLESLGEIFKITKYNVRNSNHFHVENTLKNPNNSKQSVFDGNYWYAQDPTDFICTNNIEKLKRYFPCQGKKGIIGIIDQTLLFKSDYISIVSDLAYDRKTKIVKINIQISSVIPKQNFETFFLFENYVACPLCNSSQLLIDSSDQNTKTYDLQNLTEETNPFTQQQSLLPQLQNITSIQQKVLQNSQKYVQPVTSERYMGDRWFDFDGNLVHIITNNNQQQSISVITTEYLIWQFQPILHKMKMIRNGSEEVEKINYTLDIDENNSYKFQFFFDLKPLETVRIIIPMHKLMKSFENYPHDPQRGHDLISGSLIYQQIGQQADQQIYHIGTKNLLVRLPEPDFSMPFNIMTYVCVLLGYVFLTFYLNSATKPK